ncbi:hypothetical protein FHG87_005404 [Trinorchestia longiramus]|nr:hypothetical protein FHG87_005404 [Trinorchestia longiramus]
MLVWVSNFLVYANLFKFIFSTLIISLSCATQHNTQHNSHSSPALNTSQHNTQHNSHSSQHLTPHNTTRNTTVTPPQHLTPHNTTRNITVTPPQHLTPHNTQHNSHSSLTLNTSQHNTSLPPAYNLPTRNPFCGAGVMGLGTGETVTGCGGGVLVMAGATQAAVGVYCLATTPIFRTASNLWTGCVGVVAGLLLLLYTWRRQTNRKAKLVLTIALIVLTVNVINIVFVQVSNASTSSLFRWAMHQHRLCSDEQCINIVFVQVGETGYFLSDEDKIYITAMALEEQLALDEDKIYITAMALEEQLALAVWLSTGATCLALVASFVVAQVVFCLSLRSPVHLKGHFTLASRYNTSAFSSSPKDNPSEDVFQSRDDEETVSRNRQVVLPKLSSDGKSRFFPPSRLRASHDYDSSMLLPVGRDRLPSSETTSFSVDACSRHNTHNRGYLKHELGVNGDLLQPITNSNLVHLRCDDNSVIPQTSLTHVERSTLHDGRSQACSPTSTISSFLHFGDSNSKYLDNEFGNHVNQTYVLANTGQTHGYTSDQNNLVTQFDDRTVPINNLKDMRRLSEGTYDLPYFGPYLTEDEAGEKNRVIELRKEAVHIDDGSFARESPAFAPVHSPEYDKDYDGDEDEVFDSEKQNNSNDFSKLDDEVILRNRSPHAYHTIAGRAGGVRRKSFKDKFSLRLRRKSNSYKRTKPIRKDELASDEFSTDIIKRNTIDRRATGRIPSYGLENAFSESKVNKKNSAVREIMPEESVPYFLRNHPNSWNFILPKSDLEKDSTNEDCSESQGEYVVASNDEDQGTFYTPHLINRYSTFRPGRYSRIESHQPDAYSDPFDMSRPSDFRRASDAYSLHSNTMRPSFLKKSYIECVESPFKLSGPGVHEQNLPYAMSLKRNKFTGGSRSSMTESCFSSHRFNRDKFVPKCSNILTGDAKTNNLEDMHHQSNRKSSLVKDCVEYLESARFSPALNVSQVQNANMYFSRNVAQRPVQAIPEMNENLGLDNEPVHNGSCMVQDRTQIVNFPSSQHRAYSGKNNFSLQFNDKNLLLENEATFADRQETHISPNSVNLAVAWTSDGQSDGYVSDRSMRDISSATKYKEASRSDRKSSKSSLNFHLVPGIEDSLASTLDSKQRSGWVFSSDDDPTVSLYPIGLELPILHGGRKPPLRHSSFAIPRYAKVHQRPKRSQSFAEQRDLTVEKTFDDTSRSSYPIAVPTLPRPKFFVPSSGEYSKQSRPVSRSNSLQITKSEARNNEQTLSNKFQGCSLDELESSSVLEVGSLASGKSSEPSLVDALVDIPSKCINACQLSRPISRDNNESSETDSRAKLYSVHSFSSPTLNSMETLEKTSTSSDSSNSPERSIPESDYARPRSLHFAPCYYNYQINSAIASKATDINVYSLSENSLPSFYRQNFPAQQSRSFLPRLTPVKSESNIKSAVGVDMNIFNMGNDTRQSEPQNDYYSNVYASSRQDLPDNDNSLLNFREKPSPKFTSTRYHEARVTHFESTPLPVIEETDRLSNEESSSQTDQKEDFEPVRPGVVTPIPMAKPPSVPTTPKPKIINVTKNGITKPPRYSVLQKKILNQRIQKNTSTLANDRKVMNTSHSYCESYAYDDASLKTEDGSTNERPVNIGTLRPKSKYEVAHREALGESDQLLGRIPSGEIRRNKIVLRVPSFRTAGCQTESYKPIRRRASCAQANLSVAPRNKHTPPPGYMTIGVGASHYGNPTNRSQPQPELSSSSSSGYSSPEVSSKEPSPQHSGPPSPSDKVVLKSDRPRRSKSNVTVIEINKSENTTLISTISAPPRPPKPVRLRHSAAADFSGNNSVQTIHRRAKLTTPYNDMFGLSALQENIFTLTEAVNPFIIPPPRYFSSGPQINREKELVSKWSNDTGGRATAAYLASLELLASHYRHQALLNAKQLQKQKELLQKQQQQQDLEQPDRVGGLLTDECIGPQSQRGGPWRATIEQLRGSTFADLRGVWPT